MQRKRAMRLQLIGAAFSCTSDDLVNLCSLPKTKNAKFGVTFETIAENSMQKTRRKPLMQVKITHFAKKIIERVVYLTKSWRVDFAY